MCVGGRHSSTASAPAPGGVSVASHPPFPRAHLRPVLSLAPAPLPSCCSYATSFLFVETVGGWRAMYGLAALPALVVAAGVAWLPESPRWLLLSGAGPGPATEALRRCKGRWVRNRVGAQQGGCATGWVRSRVGAQQQQQEQQQQQQEQEQQQPWVAIQSWERWVRSWVLLGRQPGEGPRRCGRPGGEEGCADSRWGL